MVEGALVERPFLIGVTEAPRSIGASKVAPGPIRMDIKAKSERNSGELERALQVNFEEVTRFHQVDNAYRGQVPEEWRQGRTAYGGLLAAAAIRAMKTELPSERKLRHFSAQFVAAATGDLEMQVTTLASGGSMTSKQAVVLSEGSPCTVVLASFGTDRPVGKAVEASSLSPVDPSSLERFPYIEGVTPNFTRFVDYRYTEGSYPFSAHSEARLGGYCRHKTPAGAPDEAAIGLLDAWPPAVLPLLRTPSPASTVSWSAHFYDPPTHPIEDWWFYRAETVRYEEGYATTQAHLHAPDGRLVAWSEQLVSVYEKSTSNR